MGGSLDQPPFYGICGDICIMTKFARFAALAVAATLVATPALAVPVGASPKAKASAKIVRPLTLTATQDLNFGTIVVGTLTSAQAIAVSQSGVLSGCTGALTCSGTVSAAQYNVTGTKSIVVNVAATASDLTNTTSGNSETLVFTPNAPATHTLANSGAPGSNFNVGGSISIAPTTVDGLYVGDIEVTVDY